MPDFVKSADGSAIAYEVFGESGPPVLLIGGAFNDRRSPIGEPLARLLAARGFRTAAYDRRGRGDSGVAHEVSTEREIEDVRAVIAALGAPACVFGHSSGAALALEAAIAGAPIAKLVAYEPPYSADAASEAESVRCAAELDALIAAGRNADAAAFFMGFTGMPQDMIEGMKHAPVWPGLVRIAPTLRLDIAALRHGGDSYAPAARLAAVSAPLCALAGGNSPAFMHDAGKRIASAAPNGVYRALAGMDHMSPPEELAPHIAAFFAA